MLQQREQQNAAARLFNMDLMGNAKRLEKFAAPTHKNEKD